MLFFAIVSLRFTELSRIQKLFHLLFSGISMGVLGGMPPHIHTMGPHLTYDCAQYM